MQRLLLGLGLWVGGLALAGAGAATLTETFETDPWQQGWKVHGDQDLFTWRPDLGAVEVTWDSSRPNSYFHHPLGTVVTRDDDFALEFRVRLNDIAIGTTPDKPYTFQIAVGLLNLQNATASNFNRGSGIDNVTGPKNLVEFGYFPDSGFGATVALVTVSTNNRFVFSHNFPLEMTPGDSFHVLMSYHAANHSLQTTMTRNGQPFGSPPDNRIAALSLEALPDFRVDTFAISSYNDAGQKPPEFSGSVRAHGIVDDVAYTVPAPPVEDLKILPAPSDRLLQFTGRTGWVYQLERTRDLSNWTIASLAAWGSNGVTTLSDTNSSGTDLLFYRLRADRP